MKILIIGAGITGCSLANILKERGHSIFIKEKLTHIGGLCYSKRASNGLLYEPYGGHTFHTSNNQVKEFVQRFSKFNNYIHNKGIIINGFLRHYPISIKSIKEMPEAKQILKELEERPNQNNMNNFETFMISLFGPTLYNLTIYNYTKKMWGIEPRNLTAEWAPKRLELRKSNSELFEKKWQGLPINGYTSLLEKMVSGIPIELGTTSFNDINYDLVLFSGRIDELLKYKYGQLAYRSLRFDYKENEYWEDETYGTINLPQHPTYIRKVNFKVMYQLNGKDSWIQYQQPVPVDKFNLPMYPVNTEKSKLLFSKYLEDICKSRKIIPVGRLGLFKYLDMDKAISLSLDMIELIENWKNITSTVKNYKIKTLLENY